MTAYVHRLLVMGVLGIGLTVEPSMVGAQEVKSNASAEKTTGAQQSENQDEQLYKKFAETLTDAKLVGRFTIIGRDDQKLSQEEYHIKSVKKLDRGDFWMFTARIKYGGKDLTLPLPLEVKWAGDTPVITLTDLALPGLGTFSARVVIYNNKYAGTWSHDQVGGHLFGTIVPGAAQLP